LAGMNFCLWMREPGAGNGELADVAVVAERPGALLVNNMVCWCGRRAMELVRVLVFTSTHRLHPSSSGASRECTVRRVIPHVPPSHVLLFAQLRRRRRGNAARQVPYIAPRLGGRWRAVVRDSHAVQRQRRAAGTAGGPPESRAAQAGHLQAHADAGGVRAARPRRPQRVACDRGQGAEVSLPLARGGRARWVCACLLRGVPLLSGLQAFVRCSVAVVANIRCHWWLCITIDGLSVGVCRARRGLWLVCLLTGARTGHAAGIDQTSRNGVPRVPSARSVPRSATPIWKAGGRSGERTSSRHMTPLSVYPEMRVPLRGAPPQDNTASGREVRTLTAATESNPGDGREVLDGDAGRKFGGGGTGWRLVGTEIW
jgi:hypothetical protein